MIAVWLPSAAYRVRLAFGVCSLVASACARDERGQAAGSFAQAVTLPRVAAFREIVVAPIAAGQARPLDDEGVETPPSPPTQQLPVSAPLCEGTASGALLRNGCPEAPEVGSDCDVEGLECRYLGASPPTTEETPPLDDVVCAQVVRCALGVWTLGNVDCEGSRSDGVALTGSPECGALPIPDSPCEEGTSCGWKCGFGGGYESIATCTCGRWAITHEACARD